MLSSLSSKDRVAQHALGADVEDLNHALRVGGDTREVGAVENRVLECPCLEQRRFAADLGDDFPGTRFAVVEHVGIKSMNGRGLPSCNLKQSINRMNRGRPHFQFGLDHRFEKREIQKLVCLASSRHHPEVAPLFNAHSRVNSAPIPDVVSLIGRTERDAGR